MHSNIFRKTNLKYAKIDNMPSLNTIYSLLYEKIVQKIC